MTAGIETDYLYTEAYPAYFGNGEGLSMPAACTAGNVIDLREYPIFPDGSQFVNNKSPGPDGVVIARFASGSEYVFAQCRLMTHMGAANPNGFVPCD